MSPLQKRKNLMKIFTSTGGCGCGPKATDIIEPKPMSKTSLSDKKSSPCSTSSASSVQSAADEEDHTSTTFSLNIDASPQNCPGNKSSKTVSSHCPKLRNSFAVVKDSDNPYMDFRQSMLQMIFEKEIYSRHDLQQLLDCFLRLNSPHHHEVIIKAFMEIWNGVVVDAGGGNEETPPFTSARIT